MFVCFETTMIRKIWLVCLMLLIVAPFWGQTGSPTAPSETAPQTQVEIADSTPAEYPAEARARAIQGTVSISVVISPNGDVEKVDALDGDSLLQAAAIKATKQYKFKVRQNGQYLPLKCWANLIFDFREPNKESSTGSTIVGQLVHGDEFPKRVKVSENVMASMRLKMIGPVYPISARNNGVQGTVVLAAIIGTDGKVKDLQGRDN